jgi:N-acetylmuramoyl-L-alanine amidase CwlA
MDADYGARTREAVVAFQRSRGVGADGIVGPKMLALLKEVLAMGTKKPAGEPAGTVAAGTTAGAVVITNGYIWQHVTRCANRAIRYIAIHYTAGTTSRKGQAMQVRQVFLQRSASADFVVDDDTIVQINPDLRNYYCWAVGDAKNKWTGGGRLYGVATNRNTISIEICSTLRQGTSAQSPNHEGWSFTPQAVEQARRLVRHLMSLYGIPKERVVRHYDISGKLCPGVPGWNDGPKYDTKGRQTKAQSGSGEWLAFWNSL